MSGPDTDARLTELLRNVSQVVPSLGKSSYRNVAQPPFTRLPWTAWGQPVPDQNHPRGLLK
jgi:hypothetical protein